MAEATVTITRPVAHASVVTIAGVIDVASWRAATDEVLAAVAPLPPPEVVVIDLTTVDFFAAAGVRMLRELTSACVSRGLGLRLAVSADSVAMKVVRLARLDEQVPTFGTLTEALHTE